MRQAARECGIRAASGKRKSALLPGENTFWIAYGSFAPSSSDIDSSSTPYGEAATVSVALFPWNPLSGDSGLSGHLSGQKEQALEAGGLARTNVNLTHIDISVNVST